MQKYDTYLVLCLHPSALIPQPSAFIHQRDKHRNLLVIQQICLKVWQFEQKFVSLHIIYGV